jgi:hypothetical protein
VYLGDRARAEIAVKPTLELQVAITQPPSECGRAMAERTVSGERRI